MVFFLNITERYRNTISLFTLNSIFLHCVYYWKVYKYTVLSLFSSVTFRIALGPSSIFQVIFSLQVATLIVPWPSLSSSQAVEEVPPDTCQGFVRSKVTRGHPVEASKDGKVSCYWVGPAMCLLLGANYWSFFFHAVSWKNHWGWRFQDPKKTVIFQESCYTDFPKQKNTPTHIDLNESKLRSIIYINYKTLAISWYSQL